jgi:hypothetical protein
LVFGSDLYSRPAGFKGILSAIQADWNRNGNLETLSTGCRTVEVDRAF